MTTIDTDRLFRTKSRFCAICDSQYRWQCICPNNKVMADQVNKSFHAGKRYKGKRALEYCNEETKMKSFKEVINEEELTSKTFGSYLRLIGSNLYHKTDLTKKSKDLQKKFKVKVGSNNSDKNASSRAVLSGARNNIIKFMVAMGYAKKDAENDI